MTRRILLVAPQPFYEDRGTPIAVQHVLEALSELEYRVDVLTYPLGRPVTTPGVEVTRVGNPFGIRSVPIGFSLRKLALDVLLVPEMRRLLASQRYACIHAVEEAAFPAVVLGRRAGVPVIYDMQSSLPEQLAQHRLFRIGPVQSTLRRCERWLLNRVEKVISSTGLARTVREAAPHVKLAEWEFPPASAEVGAVEVAALRQRLAIPADARVVVYSGTFEDYQGLDSLIGAVPAVCAAVPNTVFVLVGGSENESAALKGLGRELGLNGNLRVVPRQPRAVVPTYLALANVLVSSRSYGENLPLKVFDYLAAGRPVVATDIAPHRTVLHSGRALLVYPTTHGLAEGIIRVLTQPAEAAKLASAASEYARDHLGWDRFVTTIQQAYDEVCGATAIPS